MIKIREATLADLQIIANFQVDMAKETENLQLDLNNVSWGVNKIFYDHAVGKYLIAEKDDKIIASLLILYEWSDWRNGQVIWIHSVYVQPEHRKSGVFKEMYNFIKSIVERDKNYKGIRLYVDKSNVTAQKVYESLGMCGDHYVLYEWLK